MKNISTPANTKALLEKYNLHAIKKFGQNFLINPDLINRIVTKSDIDKETGVLEIGPGLGALTELMCERAKKVVAVELDLKLVNLLQHEIEHDNFEVISNDILKQNLDSIYEKLKDCKKIFVVANLPYYISSKIIIKLLPETWIDKVVIMLQKELAERLQAAPGKKQFNNFTVITDLFFDKNIIISVGKNNFNPAPDVDSSILEMKRIKREDVEYSKFDTFIKKCFAQNRKKLTNNLKGYCDKNELISAITGMGFPEDVRPDKLSTDQYIQLFKELN